MESKDLTQDGTVDLRGQPVLASKTGKWKACAFLVGTCYDGYNNRYFSFFYDEPKPVKAFYSLFYVGHCSYSKWVPLLNLGIFFFFFFPGYEAFERMAFYGIASNLVNYLTTQLHEDTVSSVRNVNNWSGSVWLTPIFGAYIADSFLGRFWTFTFSSLIYVMVNLKTIYRFSFLVSFDFTWYEGEIPSQNNNNSQEKK